MIQSGILLIALGAPLELFALGPLISLGSLVDLYGIMSMTAGIIIIICIVLTVSRLIAEALLAVVCFMQYAQAHQS